MSFVTSQTLGSRRWLEAIAAAVMSSVDSSILSASSMAGWNVFKPFTPTLRKRKWSPSPSLKLFRLHLDCANCRYPHCFKKGSVYALWFLCSDFVYCILFPQLVLASLITRLIRWEMFCGFIVAAVLRLAVVNRYLGFQTF